MEKIKATDLIVDIIRRYGNTVDLYENGVITDLERIFQTKALADTAGSHKFETAEEKSLQDSLVLVMNELTSRHCREVQRLVDKARDNELGVEA